MDNNKHIVIIAGEESGDAHAAKLIRTLKLTHPNIRFSGIGGRHMEAEGALLVSDLARYGVTGLTAVFKYAFVIKKAFTAIKAHLKTTKPDLLILVDYPGFNLRLAKYAKQTLNLKILYYISPQIWAWKANRIHTIKANIDHMAVILPFEKVLYQKAGVPVSFVGHPLIETIKPAHLTVDEKIALNLPVDKRLIALLPGSRMNEIEYHLPVMAKVVENMASNNAIHFIMPVAKTLPLDTVKAYFKDKALPITFVDGLALTVMNAAELVVVASGTASLECALLEKPLCIIYKSSLLNFMIAMKVIKVKYLGLCNLLVNKMLATELLQYDCTPGAIQTWLQTMLSDKDAQSHMIAELKQLRHHLSDECIDRPLAAIVDSLV